MADDVEMTPVEMTPVAAEPPKVNPLPPKPGATVSALKPGLKLPPKPGATIAMKPGLKLPPKPGATIAMKPGLKLPPKPGATIAMKPGLKLPPKPGLAGGVKPAIPKPLPKPVAPGAIPPPVAAAPAPTPAPATPAPAPATTPTAATEPAATPLETLKTVTQKLKGVTQQIPQQAVLHKTGIIADTATSEAQKEAAKHKTARISLSDAMGVAPVKSEPAPMKTIRIKRPINIPTSGAAPAEKPAEAPASAPETGAAPAPAVDATSLTQRKTIKISRPGAPIRPSGKFGVKKPGATVVTPKLPTPASAAPAEGVGDVADIPDIPELPSVPPMPTEAPAEAKAGPFTLVAAAVGLAACVAVGVLLRCLYANGQLPTFCGGLGWGA